MSLMVAIKTHQLSARKSTDLEPATKKMKVAVLTTLIGEAEAIGKSDGNRPTTDSEVMALIKKFIKNLNETLSHRPDDVQALYEKELLQEYLPKQLTQDELFNVIEDIIMRESLVGPRSMGAVMKCLKEEFDGQFDAKLASQLSKDLLHE